MSPNPDLERLRFAQTVRLVLNRFTGECLAFHVRSLQVLDWSLAVMLKADGTTVLTVGPGIPRTPGPAPVRLDSLDWDRPRNFYFVPRRRALIEWLDAQVDHHNNEVSTHD